MKVVEENQFIHLENPPNIIENLPSFSENQLIHPQNPPNILENLSILSENELIPIINPGRLLENEILPVENKFITSDKYLTPLEEEETFYYIVMLPEQYSEPESGGYKSLLEDYKPPAPNIQPEKHTIQTYRHPKPELHTETHIIESYNTPKYYSHYHGIKKPVDNHYSPPKTVIPYADHDPTVIDYIPIVIKPDYAPPIEQYNPPKQAYQEPSKETYSTQIIKENKPPIEAYNKPINNYESSDIYIVPIQNYNLPSPTVIPKYTPPTDNYNLITQEGYAISHKPPEQEYEVPKKPSSTTPTSPLQIFFANLMIVNT